MAASTAPASRRITAAGVDTFIYDDGTGDVPLICVHGNPDSADCWRDLYAHTDKLGRIICPDLPGWGRSMPPEDFDGTLDSHVAWFEALLDALEVDRFRLVVHDWGCIGLAGAARRADQLERLVAFDIVPLSANYKWHWISTYMWRPPVVGELGMTIFSGWAVKTLTRLQRPKFKPLPQDWVDGVDSHLDARMKKAILQLYRSADRVVLGRHGARLKDITCPALVMWGDLDPYTGIDNMPELADALAGPVETVTLKGAGHWAFLDTPEVFNRIVNFMAT